MANIKLSEIPNAPQGVANYTMNPQYTGDVVGGEAKAEINKGYEGLMQNPQAAGAIGRAQAGFGSDMISAAGNVASGALYVAKGEKTAQLKEAEVTGMQNFYINKLNIENEFNERVNNPKNQISVAQRPAEWLKITDGGKRFMAGMTPMQQQAYMGEATNAFTKGLASTANEAHAFQQQEFASTQTAIIDNLTQGKNYTEARKVRDNAVKTGAITSQDGVKYETMFKISEQKDGLLTEFTNDSSKGELYKSVKAAGESGEVLKKYPDLSPENLVKMAKIGESIHYQNIWAKNVDPMLNRIYAGHITDVKQLSGPEWDATPPEQQQMLQMRVAYNRNPDEAVVYDKAGQNLVDTFPKDLNNPAKELLDRKTWIMGNVSDATAPVLIKELDNKFAEMVGNNGRLKPETEVATNLSRGVNAYLKGQMFGDYSESPTDGTESQASTKAADAANSVKEQVMKGGKIGNTTYPSGPPATSHEAYQRLESAMQKRIQASDASELFKKKEQHGAIWKFFHPSAPASKNAPDDVNNPTIGSNSVSPETVDFVIGQEGFNPNRYTDSDKDTGSIGHGTYAKKGETTIDRGTARVRLQEELAGHQQDVKKVAAQVGLELSPAQLTALTSFAFNEGSGNAEKVIKESRGDMKAIAAKLTQYTKARQGGKMVYMKGLDDRRKAEIALLNS